MAKFSIAAETTVGPVSLTVSNLGIAERFYNQAIGLVTIHKLDGVAVLGTASKPLVELYEQPGAERPGRTTGLYHFALLVPTRLELARSLKRLIEGGHMLQGAADHLVSEALYLSDPDGNGIEIYCDRPRDEWKFDGDEIVMATEPLDLERLLGELPNRDVHEDFPLDGRMGHVHLHVADLEAATEFYRDLIGFDVMARYGPSAIFLSAGGYHHHLGLNTWNGVGAPPPPANSAGLRHFAVLLPTEQELDRLLARVQAAGVEIERLTSGAMIRDPSDNAALLTHR